MVATFAGDDFDAGVVAAAKRGRRVSVCLPARNEEQTIGQVVATVVEHLTGPDGLVDEIVVVDDGSLDATASVAAAAGARVVAASSVLPDYGVEHGKGQAMWRGLHVTTGDLVVFCDADVRDFGPGFVVGLLGPLLDRDDLALVKGFYRRPLDGRPGEGGRVTELVARPLVSMLFPHLGPLVQPLAGEVAARREVLEAVPFVGGYGVDLGLLIDVATRFGPASVGQSDLGERVHRNRSLTELGEQATAVLQVAMDRAGMAPAGADGGPWSTLLQRPGGEVEVTMDQRPPLGQVPAHRGRA